MIIIPILLALFTWILILWLCEQYKHINIFEQIALWFVSALSLFVFELFLQWIIFDKLSLLLPILSFVICLWLFIFKCIKKKWYRKEIADSIKWNFIDMKNQFKSQKYWQKILVCFFCVYALAKCFMAFSINLHMPTFDEDAVTGRDLKTKVFTENKSLVLDKDSPEYLWSAYERNFFAPLTDSYFLLANDEIKINQTDIISPIIYLLSVLVLFWILLRKWNLFFASLSNYIFTSIPFIFIHWFGSYFNFISWVLLFIFIIYLIDQLLENNKNILIPISLLWFLTTTIRNESFILIIAIVLMTLIFYYILNKKDKKEVKIKFKYIWYILIPLIIWIISIKYMSSLNPDWTSLNIWTIWLEDSNWWAISIFFNNLFNEWLIKYFLQQWFYHTDYNLIFLVLIITIIYCILRKIEIKQYILHLISFIVLLWWTFAILVYNYENLWLITHYWFIRFSTVYVVFLVFNVVYMMYLLYNDFLEK